MGTFGEYILLKARDGGVDGATTGRFGDGAFIVSSSRFDSKIITLVAAIFDLWACSVDPSKHQLCSKN